MALLVRMLGTFEVLVDERQVGPGPEASMPRSLLALLTVHANSVVSKESLIDDLWDEAPASARNIVEKYVSSWRKVLSRDRLRTVNPGYELHLNTEENELASLIDKLAVANRIREGGDHAAAAAAFRDAFRMWRGEDIVGFARPLLPVAEAQHLINLYLRTLEGWAGEAGMVGSDPDVIEPLRAQWIAHPHRERLSELLMQAYYQDGEQSEALAVFDRVRQVLADDLGQDPGTALRRMHARVLRQDPSLIASRAVVPAPVFRIPGRNPRFVGRADQLARLGHSLRTVAPTAGPAAVAIWGTVGVGKTALALEYAYQERQSYEVVWFINAAGRTTTADALESLANRLGLAIPADREGEWQPLWERLQRAKGWLLIFDDVLKPDDLAEFWPTVNGGKVLVTSLNPDWARFCQTLELGVLTQSETIALLASGAGSGDRELAADLDGLPLACEQAAAYIRQTGMSVEEYRRLFRRRRAQLLERGLPNDHAGTIFTTWRLAHTELMAESPETVTLLRLCAHLAGDDIDIDLLRRSPELLPSELASPIADDVKVEDLIGRARRYSLISREGGHLRMHRLVQAVVLSSLPSHEAAGWRLTVARLLAAWAPATTTAGTWADWQRVVPHLIQKSADLDEAVLQVPDFMAALHRASDYLARRGSFDDAGAVLRAVRDILQQSEMRGHELGRTLIELGEVLEQSGRLDDAMVSLQGGLECLQEDDAPDLAWIARSSAGLIRVLTCHAGTTTWKDEELPEVEQRFVDLLSLLTTALGPDHLVVAQTWSGLGQIRQDRGDVASGIECQRRALAITSPALGDDHPDVGHLYDKLGYAYGLDGDIEESKSAHRQALDILTHSYGEGHPETGWPLSNLGVVLLRGNSVTESISMQRRAREIFRAAFGDAPPTHIASWRLALAERAAGRVMTAKELLAEAAPRLAAHLGANHPDVIRASADLAAVETAVRTAGSAASLT